MADEEVREPARVPTWKRPLARRIGFVVLALLGILLVGALIATLSVRSALIGGQADLRRARAAFIAGDASGAETAFSAAGERFHSVRSGAAGSFLAKLTWIPILGRSPAATLAVSDAGASGAEAGTIVAKAIENLPGGLGALSPSGGGFAIDTIPPLARAAVQADGVLTRALTALRRSPGSLLFGPVSHARSTMVQELLSLDSETHSAAAILQGLPSFLGQGGARHYFLAAQDPAEQRGTGGVIGAYTILTIARGRFSFGPFKPIQSLPIPPLSKVPPPSAEYAHNYDQFRGGGRFWLAINATPDFPTAAQAILNAYKVAEGVQLDGVIFTDPFALSALLRIEGPARIPDLNKNVNYQNVVDFVTNGAFSIYPNPNVRKKVLGSVATTVVQGFINGPQSSIADLKILARAAGEGHLLVFSTNPSLEDGLRQTGAGGAMPMVPGDFLSVIENSAGANKVDYYQDRTVTDTVVLGNAGSATTTTEVQLTNNAPTSGEPAYVIGPHQGASKVGESSQLLNVYCGAFCKVDSVALDGAPLQLSVGSELGYVFSQQYFRTPSGQTSVVKIDSTSPNAWQAQGSGGVYQLTYLGQTTVKGTSLHLEVIAPEGAHITSATPSMQIQGATAVWTGEPTRQMKFTVAFAG